MTNFLLNLHRSLILLFEKYYCYVIFLLKVGNFMKKMRFVVLSLLVIFLCCGCNGNVTRAIRHDGFTIANDKIICEDLTPSKNEGYEKIRYFNSVFAITENGKIYELSLSQKFSNNENCKKADTKLKVSAIFNNQVIRASDGKFYYILASDKNEAYSVVPESDNNYSIYKLLLSDNDILKVITVDQNAGSYYILKSDGNVYNYVISKATSEAPFTIVSTSIVYNKNNYGGQIIDFNEAGDSQTTYVRTSNEIYRMQVTNEEDCGKYADITCEYSMSKDETLTEYNDKILAYDGSTLITTYLKQFTASAQ